MVGRGPSGGSNLDLQHTIYDLTRGHLEVRELERHVYTIDQRGSPFFDGFVTEEAREALRSFGGFPPCFVKRACLSHTLPTLRSNSSEEGMT